eukprot:6478430-Amphidinium_carterae.2
MGKIFWKVNASYCSRPVGHYPKSVSTSHRSNRVATSRSNNYNKQDNNNPASQQYRTSNRSIWGGFMRMLHVSCPTPMSVDGFVLSAIFVIRLPADLNWVPLLKEGKPHFHPFGTHSSDIHVWVC